MGVHTHHSYSEQFIGNLSQCYKAFKGDKSNINWKKINKLSFCANNMIAYVDNSQNKCRTIPRVMSKFIEYKVNTKNQTYFYIPPMNKWQLKLRFSTIYIHS